ncbi:hypothetical protein QBC41DRAFT_259930 [Cercophora samala]|uniref:C2H2-type domain-containing protein n=1 Tax=Cercophora samala TaxID=330535 RepID=A0AA39Z2L8_9PEZI|nr:hypothetical protein QBC41DRAFT_259930 [Cercophora samala]
MMEIPARHKASGWKAQRVRARESQEVRAKAPLAAQFEDCTQALRQLQTAIDADPSLDNLRDIADRCLDQLKAWGLNTGATSRRLDHSLRRAKDLQSNTLMLLKELHELIVNASESLPAIFDEFGVRRKTEYLDTPVTIPLTSPLDQQKPQDLLEILGLGDPEGFLVKAEEILEELTNLLLILLEPIDDVETKPPPDADQQETSDRGHATAAFPTAPGFLIDRLVRANRHRRHYIHDLKQLEDDSSLGGTDRPSIQGGAVLKITPPAKSRASSSVLGRVRGYRRTMSSRPGSEAGASRTTPSIGDRLSYFSRPIHELESATSYSSVGQDINGEMEIRDPPEPPVDIEKVETIPFLCQYCRFEVPLEHERIRMTHDEWVAHFYLDLRPYSCTFEECSKGHKLFGVKNEWLQHEYEYHRAQKTWYCGSAACKTEFATQVLFEQHVRSAHSEKIEPSVELPEDLVNEAQRLSLQSPPSQCALCGRMFKEIQGDWRDHIAFHLEQYALLALGLDEAGDSPHEAQADVRDEFVSDWRHSQQHASSNRAEGGIHGETSMTAIQRSITPEDDGNGGVVPESYLDSSGGGKRGDRPDRAWIEDYVDQEPDEDQPSDDDEGTIAESFDTVWLNVPPRNKEFVGRADDLEHLNDFISKPGHICVISGRGGIGKTATAVEYARRYSQNFETVIWIEAEDQGGLADRYNSIGARIFHQEPENQDDTSNMLEVRGMLSGLERPWLMIFDNVEAWHHISRYIPRSLPKTKGSILITTRDQALIRMDGSTDSSALKRGLHRVKLEPLTPNEAAEFLIAAVDRHWDPSDDLLSHPDYDQVVRTAQLVERLPLAVIMVAGYLKTSRATLDDFEELWQEKVAYRETEKNDMALTITSENTSLDILWDIGISELSVPARNLLEILAFLDPENIQKTLLVANHTEKFLAFLNATQALQYKRMIRDLAGRKLIEVRTTEDGDEYYRIHRLLQRKIVYDVGFQLKFDSAMRKATCLVRKRFPNAPPQQTPAPENWKQCKEHMPHINSLYRAFTAAEKTFPKFERLTELADLFYDAGFYVWDSQVTGHDGLALLDAAERIYDQHLSIDPMAPRRADIHCMSGLLRCAMGCQQRQESLRRLKLARNIRKHVYVQDNTRDNDVLLQNAATDYAIVLLNQYEFAKAEGVFERCLEHYRTWDIEANIPFEYSKYYYNMGVVRMCQERLDEAVEFLQHSVELVESAFGKAPQYWDNYFMLACAIRQQSGHDNYKRSLDMHQEILKARLESLGKYNKATILSKFAVGGMYVLLGDLGAAIKYLEECVELGTNSNWTKEALGRAKLHLACVYRQHGVKLQEADELERDSMRVLEEFREYAAGWFRGVDEPLMTYDDLQATDEGRYIGRMLLRLIWARNRGEKEIKFYLDLTGKTVTMRTGL